VYEKFFQGFSVKVADTHGIVYTPQPIVEFMVRSVDEILKREFGRKNGLGSKGVHILDPFVGTGNFMLRVMRQMTPRQLIRKYEEELHCNEVMLLPYYIASMNIEHEYNELTNQYKPFNGICLVDTFELVEKKAGQMALGIFTEANSERVQRQQQALIPRASGQAFVVIGNPPYNAGQVNENDNNKNRKYPVLDQRIRDTYSKDSKATLVRKLNDPYVKAFRWASDRIGEEGIIALVTNNSFVNDLSFDGMRKHLVQDFDTIYLLDLGGNVRQNPKLSGTTHNVFGIQVGVSVVFLVKHKKRVTEKPLYYAATDEFWRKEQKYGYLNDHQDYTTIDWQALTPNKKHTWLTEGLHDEFDKFLPIGTKAGKRSINSNVPAIFKLFSLGIATNRDNWVYGFQQDNLEKKVRTLIKNFNFERIRFSQTGKVINIDHFVNNEPSFIKWTDRLKKALKKGQELSFKPTQLRSSIYRPYTKQFLYFDRLLNQRRARQTIIFPTPLTEAENRVICVAGIGNRKGFGCLVTNQIPSLDLAFEKTQCFPFYTYDEDGTNRQENITDWALEQFRNHYNDASISKWHIFHYVYALLHHPAYRTKYAKNLKRALPHIPYAPDFHAFASAGRQLATLHVDYEDASEYELSEIENPNATFSLRVEKMKLSKDKSSLKVNDYLTLAGIPPQVFAYKLGNRSALHWVIDQYRIKTHKRSGITNDPNRRDDPDYILRLIGQVITVSLETVRIVEGLPGLGLDS